MGKVTLNSDQWSVATVAIVAVSVNALVAASGITATWLATLKRR